MARTRGEDGMLEFRLVERSAQLRFGFLRPSGSERITVGRTELTA